MLESKERSFCFTPDQIKPGFCYINKRKNGLVRKVLSIESEFVYYKPLNGAFFKRNINSSKCKLKNFLKWATKIVEEKEEYSTLATFEPKQFYTVLDTNNNVFLKCQIKKLNWYLKKGIVEWVDKELGITKFTTDHIKSKILNLYDGKLPSALSDLKYQHCVVCGSKKNLTRHHVVPKKEFKLYPLEIKSFVQNYLSVCHSCHLKYEKRKHNLNIEGYTTESAITWMNHFVETMKPKFLSEKWHILKDYYLKNEKTNN